MASEANALGPISYLIVEFPGNKMTGDGTRESGRSRRPRRHPDPRPHVRHPRPRRRDAGRRGARPRRRRRARPRDLRRVRRRVCSTRAISPMPRRSSSPASSAGILIFENTWATSFVNGLTLRRRRAGRGRLHPAGRNRGRARRRRQLITPTRGRRPCLDYSEVLPGRRSLPELRRRCRTAFRAGRRIVGRNKRSSSTRNSNTPSRSTPRRAPAAAPAADPIQQLKDLADLKNQGILTEAEFDAQKAKILAQ